MDELTKLRTQASTAGGESTKLQESIPGLLQGLKSNLTSIFTRDNPMMQERENALTTFLNLPSQTRADLLPGGMPIVEGSPLTLSPTQQNAILEARRNAALVPLAGLNQSIVGQYGNIGDILSNAANLYQSQVLAGKNRADIAQKAFENALAQEKEAREGRTAGGMDFSSLITALLGGQQQPAEINDEWEVVETPQTPISPTDFRSQPLEQTQTPGLWDRFMGLLGATPRQGLEQPIQPGGLNLAGYNFGNIPIKLGV